jgi:hypothetical protein
MEDFDVARLVDSAQVPLLVVHDRDDREVAWRDGTVIAASAPGGLPHDIGPRAPARAP